MKPYKMTKIMTVEQAKEILSTVDHNHMKEAIGHRRRSGAGRVNNLSKYCYQRKDIWPDALCESVKKHLPESLWENYLQMHILRIPNSGFLDLQTAWRDTGKTEIFNPIPAIASFVCISLGNEQSLNLYIDDEPDSHHCNAGDAIFFDPEIAHEILPVSKEEDWLVLMIGKPFSRKFLNEYRAA